MKKRSDQPKRTKPASRARSTGGDGATFSIVGIGASAGGLEAATRLLRHLPPNRIEGVVLTLSDIDAVKRSLVEAEHARQFAEAIIATVREPLLVLDGELRVTMANHSFYDLFRVKPAQTEKKFIFELGDGQWNIPALRELLEKILPAKTSFQDFRVEHDFPGIGRKTMLLNARRLETPQNHLQWILLAMEDVTNRD